MSSMLRLFLLFMLAVPKWAESRPPQPVAEPAVERFAKGDRVVFIGDSITHGGGYHRNIHLFYATRFPERPFEVFNAGISGDTTPGTNRRFKSDIAVHEPTVATIMLGMNDAWAWLFADRGEDLPEWKISSREKAYKTYTSEMRKLAESLAAIDCRIVFLKPSIYDETALLNTRNLIGKNVLLRRFSEALDDLAADYGGEVIDFHTPMCRLNAELQQEDPTTTIVGRDRVHPCLGGQFVMFYHFLKAQQMPSVVSTITIDAAAGKVAHLENCQIESAIRVSTTGVEFTATERALPYPLAVGELKALEWVPFQRDFNQQTFKVKNLEPGDYRLRIDGRLVGFHSAEELAQGINQSRNMATPQNRQALRVAAVEDQRREVVDRLRAIAQVRHNMLSKFDPPVSEDRPVALKQALSEHLEKSRDQSWHGYLKKQAATYLEWHPQEDDLRQEAESLRQKVWTINQPKQHRWKLEPVEK